MPTKALIVCSGLMVFSALASFAQKATGPTTQPILRTATETHTTFIDCLDIDDDGRYILTASIDKTARLWDARDGKLLRVLRPPIDAGYEGQLNACALSPDGRLAAVAGHTGFAWASYGTVYVFDTSSGIMVRRIQNLPSSIHDLAFSLDGRFLAAALWKDGVRVIDTSSWRIVHSLRGYGEGYRSVSFDRTGRLAVVCRDGTVRLYDASFTSFQSRKTSAGNLPLCVSFSADGSKIAVGFQDSNRIEVLSGEDLHLLYEPQTLGSRGDAHFSVCWSNDGETLFAGGWYNEYRDGMRRFPIESWSGGDRVPALIYTASTDTISDIEILPDGSLVYSGAPDLGRIDPQGRAIFSRRGEICQNNDQRDHLRINDDGSVVGFTPMGKQPYTFDIKKCQLIQKASEHPLALTGTKDISISNWAGSNTPVLNGIKVSHLPQDERCASVSISAKGKDILLGADWNIYCLDPEGGLKWKIPAEGAWAVNIAGNDEVFAAAYGDGTIRWHRLLDGALLLTLFVHADGKRWIVWTPSGYFAASEGGDELAGWHFNNGSDSAALFYSLSRFAKQFHRPDVVQSVLQYRSVEQALAEANRLIGKASQSADLTEFLPPVAAILSPEDRETVVTERLEIRLLISTVPRHPATEVRVLVNGKPAEGVRERRSPAGRAGEEQRSLSLALPSGEYEIDVLAKNDAGFGDPAQILIYYTKPELPRQKLNVLAVGISKYNAKALALRYAAKDAQDFVAKMKAQKGRLYEDVTVCLLTDAAATKKATLEGLQWLRSRTRVEDASIVFLTGHEVRGFDGEPYYLPVDADLNAIEKTALPAAAIDSSLRDLAGRIVILLDTCHKEGECGGIMKAIASSETQVTILSASSGEQYAQENEQWLNGAFCGGLLEGLDGKADYTKDGQISVNELEIYVRKSVRTLTGGAQIPISIKPSAARDFPIAFVTTVSTP